MKLINVPLSRVRSRASRSGSTLTLVAAAMGLAGCAPIDPSDEEGTEERTAVQALTAIGTVPYTNAQAIDTCYENLELRATGPAVTIRDVSTTTSTAQATLPSGAGERAMAYARVSFRIEHTYVGDLVVELVRGSSVYMLANREGGPADVLQKTVDVPIVSDTSSGAWTLRVRDLASGDSGRLVSYSIQVHHMNTALESAVASLQTAVNTAYNPTRVRFTGWQRTCAAATAQTIRVTVYESPDGAGNGSVGRVSVPVSTSISWTRSWVHEFGHALGLGHEHWNPFSTCSEENKTPGYNPATPSDPDSIMSYCASGSSLTALDRLVIQRRYGATGTFSMSPSGYVVRTVGPYNLCHVASETQMAAFGGFGLTARTSIEFSGSGLPDCAWPDGMYREPHTGAYRFVLDGAVCHLDTMDKVNAYGGPDERIEVPSGTNVNAGSPALVNRGVCPWPRDGFFRVPAYSEVIRVSPSGACRVANANWMAHEALGYRSLPAANAAVPTTPTQLCLWPAGNYRNQSNPNLAFYLNAGSDFCRYQNSEHLTVASSGGPVATVASTLANDPASPLFGRSGGSTCLWPSGHYRDTDGLVYALDWDSTAYCVFRNEAERLRHQATVSGFANITVRTLSQAGSDFRVGRPFNGPCFP